MRGGVGRGCKRSCGVVCVRVFGFFRVAGVQAANGERARAAVVYRVETSLQCTKVSATASCCFIARLETVHCTQIRFCRFENPLTEAPGQHTARDLASNRIGGFAESSVSALPPPPTAPGPSPGPSPAATATAAHSRLTLRSLSLPSLHSLLRRPSRRPRPLVSVLLRPLAPAPLRPLVPLRVPSPSPAAMSAPSPMPTSVPVPAPTALAPTALAAPKAAPPPLVPNPPSSTPGSFRTMLGAPLSDDVVLSICGQVGCGVGWLLI